MKIFSVERSDYTCYRDGGTDVIIFDEETNESITLEFGGQGDDFKQATEAVLRLAKFFDLERDKDSFRFRFTGIIDD